MSSLTMDFTVYAESSYSAETDLNKFCWCRCCADELKDAIVTMMMRKEEVEEQKKYAFTRWSFRNFC